MLHEISIKSILNKTKNNNLITTNKEADLKTELTRLVFNTNDDYLINSYYKDKNDFLKLTDNLFKNNLNHLSKHEIKLLSFLSNLNEVDIKYIMSM